MIALWYMLPESTQLFLTYIFSGANLPYTTLLLLMVLYWILVIFGALDIELFDVDIDADLDAPDGLFQSFLAVFNIGELPLMLIMSFMVMGVWSSAILAHFILPDYIGGAVALIAIPINLIIGSIVGWITMKPVAIFFNKNRETSHAVQIIGNMGTSRFSMNVGETGQIEIPGNPSPVLVTVKVADSSSPINKGDQVVVLKELGPKKYLAKKMESDSSDEVELLVKRD